MRIAIVGAGNIGSTLARLFVEAGREVAICNSRSSATLNSLTQSLHNAIKPVATDTAVDWGEIVVLAIPLREYRKLKDGACRDKIVVDAMNYQPQRDGPVPSLDSGEMTSSEMVAQHLSNAQVIKCFNTIPSEHLAHNGSTERLIPDRQAIFLAGDDRHAKSVISGLIEDIGFAPVDTGSLREGGRKQQPGAVLYGRVLTAREALVLLRK